MSGKFIVFDGLPGSGKGTQIKKVFEYIFDKDKKFDNILITDEPTQGPFGLEIRELFKKQKTSDDFKDELFDLFVKDREWHINSIIKPALEKNFIVLCDRYKYSSIAYQTVQGTDFEKVFSSHKNFLAPTLSLIFDVDPNIAVERISKANDAKRKDTDKFREFDFVFKLRKYFLDLPKQLPSENIKIINANLSINSVFEQIKIELDSILY
ncbi:MAG: dTMP kinase [Candidatus ainarchaeum sp.]|nr:dTMP kinase [Candidatus ainarchaeum sp.]